MILDHLADLLSRILRSRLVHRILRSRQAAAPVHKRKPRCDSDECLGQVLEQAPTEEIKWGSPSPTPPRGAP